MSIRNGWGSSLTKGKGDSATALASPRRPARWHEQEVRGWRSAGHGGQQRRWRGGESLVRGAWSSEAVWGCVSGSARVRRSSKIGAAAAARRGGGEV